MKHLALSIALLLCALSSYAQESPAERVELLPYGDMEHWTTRVIKEAAILGGATKKCYHMAPTQTLTKARPWVRGSSDSPWGSSSVWASPVGIDKVSVTVFPEEREPGNLCARLEVIKDSCKALGIVKITVVVTGSIYLGAACEPIKNAKNPQEKIDQGIPFTQRPKALQLDYKLSLADQVIKATGLKRPSKIEGKDNAEISLYLIQRWETKTATSSPVGWEQAITNSANRWRNGKTDSAYPFITATSATNLTTSKIWRCCCPTVRATRPTAKGKTCLSKS